MMIDPIKWYLLLTLIGWLALPISYHFFTKLPDRGYALSRSLGMLLLGFAFWLGASYQIFPNTPGGVLSALAIVTGISVWQLRKGRWRELVNWLKKKRSLVLATEIVFFVAFWFMVIMRAASPEINGTEKPMEMAFINAIMRSPSFPPNDPWLSGYSISYYYFGYVLVAILIHLTGTASSIAFNLGIVMSFSMAAVAVYGIVYCLLKPEAKTEGDSRSFKWWAGLGPLFILVVSNLEGFFEMIHSAGLFWKTNADGTMTSRFWEWLNVQELVNPPSSSFDLIPSRVGGNWWWRASRVLQDFNLASPAKSYEIIDEFPFFSYLLSDLHPHVLAMPYVFLAMGMALNIFRTGSEIIPNGKVHVFEWIWGWLGEKRRPFCELALLSWIKRSEFWLAVISLGGLAFFNTWDFPFYTALFGAAYILSVSQVYGFDRRRILEFFELCIFLGVAGVLAYLPFFVGFASQAGGILPSLSFFTRGVYFWIMFGAFLVPIMIWLFWLVRKHDLRDVVREGCKFTLGLFILLFTFSYLLGWIGANFKNWGTQSQASGSVSPLALKLIELGNLFSGLHGSDDPSTLIFGSLENRLTSPGTWVTLFIIIALVWGFLVSICRGKQSEEDQIKQLEPSSNLLTCEKSNTGFVLLLLLVGSGLAVAPEFVYLRDNFGYRMNTIFKFYFQVWMLWGTAAAYASVILWKNIVSGWRWVFRVVWACVIGAALIYPLFGIWDETNGFNPTVYLSDGTKQPDWSLDGTLFLKRSNPDDMAAIAWLANAPLGVVAEATGGPYSDYARVATFSGQPNVLGWANHEGQWRGGGEEIGSRAEDLETLYRTLKWSDALEIIEKYHIRYVYVGYLENSTYKVSERKFEQHLDLVYELNDVRIYEVPDTLLSDTE